MEKIDILLWIMGGGFALMLVMWNQLISNMKDLSNKSDEINNRVSEVDKRLYGIETVLHMKDCCILKQDQNIRKAE